MNKLIVLLDLDGVIANWNKEVCKCLNKNYEEVLNNWNLGEYGTEKQLGVTESQMWKSIDSNPTFWEDIELFDYSQELVKYLQSKYEVHVCTSPSRHSDSLSGKGKWMARHFRFNRNFIITPQKHLLAQKGRVLIDDMDTNVNKFKEWGGDAFLWSQHWNSDYARMNNRIERLKEFLESI